MSLLLGKNVIEVLGSDTQVKAIVNDRIYPIAIPEGVPAFPFVTVETSVASAEYCKEGHVEDRCNIVVRCVSRGYDESVTLADKVRKVLDHTDKLSKNAVIVDSVETLSATTDYYLDQRCYETVLTMACCTQY